MIETLSQVQIFTGRFLIIRRMIRRFYHSIFDPAEDVHRAEFHQVKFPSGYGGLIEAN